MDQKYIIMNYHMSTDDLEVIREIFRQKPYITPRKYDHICRYTTLRRLRDIKTNKLYHENWNKKTIDQSTQDTYFIVTIREQNRLDIIANDYYSSPRFWWVIALANDIIDPFDVPIGLRLRIPDILSLYNKGGILSGN